MSKQETMKTLVKNEITGDAMFKYSEICNIPSLGIKVKFVADVDNGHSRWEIYLMGTDGSYEWKFFANADDIPGVEKYDFCDFYDKKNPPSTKRNIDLMKQYVKDVFEL